jgi:hypothetical protein
MKEIIIQTKNVRVINKKLREYYDCFEKKCPRAKIIRNSDIPERFIYTEKGFEHGELTFYIIITIIMPMYQY